MRSITNLKSLLRNANGPFLWAALAIGLAIWVVDAIVDSAFFEHSSFIGAFIVPDVEFVFMRASVLLLSATFGGVAQAAIHRRRQAETALKDEMVYRDRLAEEREHTARIQAEEEARLSFLNTISHELRTPLTVLLTFSRFVRRNRDKNLTRRQTDQLDLVVSNGQRLATMIDDMVNLSNMSSSGFEVLKGVVNVRDLVNEQAESLKPILAERSQRLQVTIGSAVETVAGDWVRLGQVISNLIGNASKFSPADALIQLSVRRVDGGVRFTVANPGPEIPASERDRVFDLFYRVDDESTRATSGTGIGLSVCRAIVEKHGGSIWLEPWLDGCNRFTFEIPTGEVQAGGGEDQTAAGC